MTTLVERFQTDVFGLCMGILRSRHDAEDVAQEVFLRVFRSLRSWDPARPLKPWIVTITINCCRTHRSRKGKRPDVVDYPEDGIAAKPDTGDGGELYHEIRAAVGELRQEYRTAFVLFHEQDMPYEFIARTLKRPVGTVKTWLHRARLQVLGRLRDRGVVPEVERDLR